MSSSVLCPVVDLLSLTKEQPHSSLLHGEEAGRRGKEMEGYSLSPLLKYRRGTPAVDGVCVKTCRLLLGPPCLSD